MKSNQGFWAVFVREWKRIINSRACRFGLFVAPLLSMIVLLWMMSSGLPEQIPIAVIDHDNSATSRSLIRQLDAFSKTNIAYQCDNFGEARELMEKSKIYAILDIPADFATDAVAGKQPKLVYYTNNSFLISGSLLFQDLKTVSTLASAAVGLQVGEAKGYTADQLMPVLMPISIDAHPLSNPWLNYSLYLNNILIPGILQLLIILFTISAFGSEVKSGNGQKLLELSGNSIFKTITGKALPYTIILSVFSLLAISLLHFYSGFPMASGFWPTFLNYVCLMIGGQGMGLLVLAVFKNYSFSVSVGSLLGVISFSISGFTFPAMAMDSWLTALGYLFPLKYFFLNYVDQTLHGYPFGYSAINYACMLAFMLAAYLSMGHIKYYLQRNKYTL